MDVLVQALGGLDGEAVEVEVVLVAVGGEPLAGRVGGPLADGDDLQRDHVIGRSSTSGRREQARTARVGSDECTARGRGDVFLGGLRAKTVARQHLIDPLAAGSTMRRVDQRLSWYSP